MLNRRFPFDPTIKNHIYLGIGFGLWLFNFLVNTGAFDLFILSESSFYFYVAIYSLMGTFGYLLTLKFQDIIYNKKGEEWKLLSEIKLNSIFLLITLILTFTVFRLVARFYDEFAVYLKDYYLPAVISLLPIFMISRWFLGLYHEKKTGLHIIEIKGQGVYENLNVMANHLIFIKAADNYVEITHIEVKKLKKTLIRTTLSEVESQHEELLRTHRSYIINPTHYKQWITKNGNHEISLSGDITVPISGSYLKNVKEVIKITTK